MCTFETGWAGLLRKKFHIDWNNVQMRYWLNVVLFWKFATSRIPYCCYEFSQK